MPVAIITGASSGIGKATALLFAKKNYQLSLSGRNESALEEVVNECIGLGVKKESIMTIIGDLRKESIAKDLVEHTIEKFGRIDVLVNSAGILVSGSVEAASLSDYDRQFDINVRSVIILTKYAIPHIVNVKGTIVNVSSIAGPCAFPGVAYYCMSKAAIDQFTKCLALELAPKGVRVNAVNPGVIRSEVHRRAGMSEEEYVQSKTTHALGRVGDADEVAEGIYFLASNQSSFTTGHLLTIDGGRGIMTPR